MEVPLLLQVDRTWTPPMSSPPKVLAFDTETRGQMHNKDFEVICCSWAWSPDVGYMCPIDELPPIILQWLEDPSVIKTGHNIKYDAQAMTLHRHQRRCAIMRTEPHRTPILDRLYLWPFRDTRHAWGLIDESATEEDRASGKDYVTIFPSLKVLARRAGAPRWTAPEELFLNLHGVSTKTKDHEKFMKVWDQLRLEAPELLYAYSAMDSAAQILLHNQLWEELSEAERQHFTFLMYVERSFIDMELNGIEIDVERLSRELQVSERECAKLSAGLMESSGMTTLSGSSPQLGVYLYDTLGCRQDGDNTKSGRPPCDKKALARLAGDPRTSDQANAFLQELAEVRTLEAVIKQARTYLTAVRDDGRIHASYNISGTRTGRTSSQVNVQNPSRKGPVRSCFISRFK